MRDRDDSKKTDASAESAFDPAMVAGQAASADRDSSSGKKSDTGRRDPTAGNEPSAEGRPREEGSGNSRQTEARPQGGRLSRITEETRGLVDDLKDWVDLKIQLIQLDIEDRIRQAANQAALTAIVLVVALFACLFGLVAAGEALGAWFDSRSLGFLTLAGILAVVAAGIHVMKPRLVEPAQTEDEEKGEPEMLQKKDTPALPEAIPAGDSHPARTSGDDR